MAIKAWSTTAANNNAASPNGFPEGMAPSGVNDAARQVMADVRAWYENAQWLDLGHTPTYVTSASFTLSSDLTSSYEAQRRVRASVGAGTIYGTILSSSWSTVATVTCSWDSGQLDASLSAVAVSALTVTNPAMPRNQNVNVLSASAMATTAMTVSTLSASAVFAATVTVSTLSASAVFAPLISSSSISAAAILLTGSASVDTISEKTADTGVTIDGLTIRDGRINDLGANCKLVTATGGESWTSPRNVINVTALLVGGGGGGASGSTGTGGGSVGSGGGGGGAGTAKLVNIAVTAETAYTITAGAGAAGGAAVAGTNASGNPGSAGSASTFGGLASAAGGGGGTGGGGGIPGAGGTGGNGGLGGTGFGTGPKGNGSGGGGDMRGDGCGGSGGLNVDINNLGGGGGGGSSFFGAGGAGSNAAVSGSSAGGNAVVYGGGGGGSGATTSPSTGAGGNGAQGFVLFWW